MAASGARACHRCIRGGGLQGQPKWWRAGRGAYPPERGQSDVSVMCELGGAEDSAQPPDRPKWRRAGSRAG